MKVFTGPKVAPEKREISVRLTWLILKGDPLKGGKDGKEMFF